MYVFDRHSGQFHRLQYVRHLQMHNRCSTQLCPYNGLELEILQYGLMYARHSPHRAMSPASGDPCSAVSIFQGDGGEMWEVRGRE